MHWLSATGVWRTLERPSERVIRESWNEEAPSKLLTTTEILLKGTETVPIELSNHKQEVMGGQME